MISYSWVANLKVEVVLAQEGLWEEAELLRARQSWT